MRKTATIIAVLAAGLASLTANWLISRVGNGPGTSGVQADVECLDIGSIIEQEEFDWKLRMHNPTRGAVTVETYSAPCNCLKGVPPPVTIAPGGVADVLLKIDTRLSPPRNPGEEAGMTFALNVTPHLKDAAGPSGAWSLRGWVARAFNLSQYAVDFGTFHEDRRPAPVVITVSSIVPVNGFDVNHDAGVNAVAEPAGHDRRWRVRVAVAEGLAPGYFRREIVLVPRHEGKLSLPVIRLPVQGTVATDFNLMPPALLLGARAVGDRVTETVTLHSDSGPFDLEALEPNSPDLTVVAAPGRNGGVLTFEATVTVANEGDRNSEVTFKIRTPDGKCRRAILRVSYTGLRAVRSRANE